jgi:hypothetical protein
LGVWQDIPLTRVRQTWRVARKRSLASCGG